MLCLVEAGSRIVVRRAGLLCFDLIRYFPSSLAVSLTRISYVLALDELSGGYSGHPYSVVRVAVAVVFLVALESPRSAEGTDLFAEMSFRYRALQGDLRTKPSFHCVQQFGGGQAVFLLQWML